MNNIIGIDLIETRGEWVLWRFLIQPKTKRFAWIRGGYFPASLFDESAVESLLLKSYDSAISEKNALEKYENEHDLKEEQKRLDREIAEKVF